MKIIAGENAWILTHHEYIKDNIFVVYKSKGKLVQHPLRVEVASLGCSPYRFTNQGDLPKFWENCQ